MSICIFALGVIMEQLTGGPGPGISDENLAQSAPMVRALVVARLEQIWRSCDPHIQVQRNPDTGLVLRPDPRFIEAGLRVCDRLADIYRLRTPIPASTETYAENRAGIIEDARRNLEALEQRVRTADQ